MTERKTKRTKQDIISPFQRIITWDQWQLMRVRLKDEWKMLDDPLHGILWIRKDQSHEFIDGDGKLICSGSSILCRGIRNEDGFFIFDGIKATTGGYAITKHQRKFIRNYMLDHMVPQLFENMKPSLISGNPALADKRITANELALYMKMDIQKLRSLLRDIGLKRIGPRWEWTADEAQRIYDELEKRYLHDGQA